MPDLQPIVQRISTKYDPTGISAFIGHLGKIPPLAVLAVAGIGAITGAIVLCINKTMAWGKELDNTMDLLGVTSKEAAGLGLIARVTGTSIDTLTRGLNIMGKGLVDTNGNLGSTGKELKAIGIDIYDVNGKLKSTPALLQEVADYMSKMSDGTAKTALEMKLFGRSGTEVDEILRQAANGGMQKYIDQAQKMGLALSADQVARIEQLGFNMNMLKEQFTGIAVVLGIAFIPMIQSAVTWIGNLVAGLMPAIAQMGMFLGLLLGLPGNASLAKLGTGGGGAPSASQYSAENQWRIAHGFQPRADREASGALPISTSSGPAPYMQGLSGDYTQHIAMQPWMQALLDLKKTITDDFWPWFSGLDWAGTITTLGNIAGWLISQAPKAANMGVGLVQDFGGMAVKNINQAWDAVGWIQTNIIDPFNTAKNNPYYEQMGWDTWLTDNLITPIRDYIQNTKFPSMDELITGIKIAFYDLGHGIGNAVLTFLYKLEDMYNNAVDWVGRILGVALPKASSHVVVPKPYASGGQWNRGTWAVIGEEGYELISPSGMVIPHDKSKEMLSGMRGVIGLKDGGTGPWGSTATLKGGYGNYEPPGGPTTVPGYSTPGSPVYGTVNLGGGNMMSNQAVAASQTAARASTYAASQSAHAASDVAQTMRQQAKLQLETQMTNLESLVELRSINANLSRMYINLPSEMKKAMA